MNPRNPQTYPLSHAIWADSKPGAYEWAEEVLRIFRVIDPVHDHIQTGVFGAFEVRARYGEQVKSGRRKLAWLKMKLIK